MTEDSYTSLHLTNRQEEFKTIFKGNLGTIHVYLSLGSTLVLSTFFNYEKVGDNLYTLFNFYWQEEDCTLHNVCRNEKDQILYDITNNSFDKDVYLEDKYGDCSDGWFISKLGDFFKKVPTTNFKRGLNIVNQVLLNHRVRRFCDNLLHKWYAPDENGVAPYALWSYRKFQEEINVL